MSEVRVAGGIEDVWREINRLVVETAQGRGDRTDEGIALAEAAGLDAEATNVRFAAAREAAQDLAKAAPRLRLVETEREPYPWELGDDQPEPGELDDDERQDTDDLAVESAEGLAEPKPDNSETPKTAKPKPAGAKSKREAPKAEKLAEPEALSSSSLSSTSVEGTRAAAALKEMDANHAVILDYGGRCLVTSMRPSSIDPKQTELSMMTFEELCKRYLNRYVDLGSRQREKLAPWWLEHPERRQYAGLLFEPNQPPTIVLGGQSYWNLWQGFGVVPKAGRWPMMQAHIQEIMTAGDPVGGDYLLRSTAWGFQNPGLLAEQASVFKGPQGIGKGTFTNAVKEAYGRHGKRIHSEKHFTGDFNAHFRDCCHALVDEVWCDGNKRVASAMKGLITEPTFLLESKGKDAIEWLNRLKVVITTNARWVVPADHDERRYTVFECSDARKGDEEYFRALHTELAGGGLAAMLHDLLAMPLGRWHPRQGYKTAALQVQKQKSLEPEYMWLEMVLQDGILPGAGNSKPVRARMKDLREDARERVPALRLLPETKIRDALRLIGAVDRKDGDQRKWWLLSLADCRRAWEAKTGPWPWEVEYPEWGTDVRSLSDVLRKPAGDID